MVIIGIRLKLGEFFGSIYIKQKITKKEILDLEMIENSMQEYDSLIRDTLEKQSIKNTVDFNEKGIENVGSGCVFIPSVFGNRMVFSQKEAEFYFKIDKKQEIVLEIQLISIPKVSGTIKLEEKSIEKFSLSSFEEKRLLIKINSNLVKHKISKIKISVDKCWNIHHIFNLFPNYPLGVGIKQISVLGN
jgi:hypothetical protein